MVELCKHEITFHKDALDDALNWVYTNVPQVQRYGRLEYTPTKIWLICTKDEAIEFKLRFG